MLEQLLPTNSIGNVWGQQMIIWILILGLKELTRFADPWRDSGGGTMGKKGKPMGIELKRCVQMVRPAY